MNKQAIDCELLFQRQISCFRIKDVGCSIPSEPAFYNTVSVKAKSKKNARTERQDQG